MLNGQRSTDTSHNKIRKRKTSKSNYQTSSSQTFKRSSMDTRNLTLLLSSPEPTSSQPDEMVEVTVQDECREPSPLVVADWLQTFKTMPKCMQTNALSDLVDLCTFAHVRHLQKMITPHFQKDFIHILPRELSLKIVSYLSPSDLINAATLSRAWLRLAEDRLLWTRMCRERHIEELTPPCVGRQLTWKLLAERRRREERQDLVLRSLPALTLLTLPSLDDEAEHPFFFCGSSSARHSPRLAVRLYGTRARILSRIDPASMGAEDATAAAMMMMAASGADVPSTSTATTTTAATTAAAAVGDEAYDDIADRALPTTSSAWLATLVGGAPSASCRYGAFCDASASPTIHADIGLKSLTHCVTRCKWKAVYLRDRRVRANWRRRRVNAACELRGHDEHVITCMQTTADGMMIVTGSDDCTVRVWSVPGAECERVLVGHTGGVWTLQLSADARLVVSGSTDRTVRVWDVPDGVCLRILNGHTSTVRCMALQGDLLVSGSRDWTIRMWNVRNGEPVCTLYGHTEAVRCVQFDGRRIVSGGYDHNLIVWDASSGAKRHELRGHTGRVYSLLYVSERDLAMSGSLDATIRVWNVASGDCLQTLVGHQSLTSGIELYGDFLVSANADSTIKVWNIADGQCVHTLAGPHRHSSAVTSLQVLKSGLVVSSGDDGTVKLWDIKRGSFVCDLLKLDTGGHGGCVWRIRATPTMLICAIGSRNFTEDTKLVLMDFDAPYPP